MDYAENPKQNTLQISANIFLYFLEFYQSYLVSSYSFHCQFHTHSIGFLQLPGNNVCLQLCVL